MARSHRQLDDDARQHAAGFVPDDADDLGGLCDGGPGEEQDAQGRTNQQTRANTRHAAPEDA